MAFKFDRNLARPRTSFDCVSHYIIEDVELLIAQHGILYTNYKYA